MLKKDQNILITGAGSGIGQALAVHYARNGAKNLFICGRNADRLNETRVLCQKFGTTVHAAIIDVTDREQVKNWLNECEKIADINLIIANAGVSSVTETEENIYNTFNTNVFGVINTVLPAIDIYKARRERLLSQKDNANSSLDQFIARTKAKKKAFFRNPFSRKYLGDIGCELYKNDNKSIAIVSSIAGYHGLPACPSYSASKACVKAWGAALRGQLKPFGINVSVICPGFVKSRITDKNTCPMPFFMQADKAAAIIAARLEKNIGLIAFPWPLRFAAWLVSILPERLSGLIYNRLPEKVSDKS